MKDVLEDLVLTPGVSGDERRVREKIEDYVANDADRVYEDDFGNLIARKGSGDKTVMLSAHMDQIGFRIKYVDDTGYLTASATGGINTTTMPGQPLWLYESDVTGIVGATPPHISDTEAAPDNASDLYIDVGADTREDAVFSDIDIGSYAVYEPDFSDNLLDHNVSAPGLDNRIGCVLGIEALERFEADYDTEYELVVAFTREEEVGLKGAKTAATHVDPDVALALDTAVAGDVPDIHPKYGTHVATGDGPVIGLQEANGRGLIADHAVADWLIGTAEGMGQPYQKEVGEGGATDAANIHKAVEGIPSGSIGVPTKHLHSPREVASMADLYETAALVDNALFTIDDLYDV